MALTVADRNAAAGAAAGAATYASLHTADPGATGAAEVTGGAPAYARRALSWGAAAGGQATTAAPVTFDVPAGTTVTHVGMWDAPTGGTFLGSGALPTPETYGGQGAYGLTTLAISIT